MDYIFFNRCNGSCASVINFSDNARALATNLVEFCRKNFKRLDPKDDKYSLGIRFYSDDTVLRRIESAATEYEFYEDPEGWLMDALRDCASADHWYETEKQW